jgi:hypothetical protein
MRQQINQQFKNLKIQLVNTLERQDQRHNNRTKKIALISTMTTATALFLIQINDTSQPLRAPTPIHVPDIRQSHIIDQKIQKTLQNLEIRKQDSIRLFN